MNEVEIPLKITGISAIKAELRALKGEIANATDPKEVQRLAQEAGVLADKLKDANEQVQVFTSGSKFESVSKSFGAMKNDLLSLDFEGAAEKAKTFQNTVKSVGSKDISGALRGLGSMITTVGTTFVQMGAAILANPIFLIAAVIAAVVTAVVVFLDKIGFLEAALAAAAYPIQLLIDTFKKLADWLGFTNYAGEENRKKEEERARAAEERRQKEQEDLQKQKDMFEELRKEKERQIAADRKLTESKIALLEAQGKSSDNIKKKLIDNDIAIAKSKVEMAKQVDKTMKGLLGSSSRDFFNYDLANAQLALNEALTVQADFQSEQVAKAKEYRANRLDAARTAKDLELELEEDGAQKEIRLNKLKYDRLIFDLKENENLKEAEKKKLRALYEKIRDEEEQKIRQKQTDALLKAEDEQFIQLQMLRSTAKEKEVLQKQLEFEAAIEKAKGNAELEKALFEQLKIDIAAIGKKYDDQDIENKKEKAAKEKEIIDAQIQAEQALFDARLGFAQGLVSNLAGLVTKNKKIANALFLTEKALAIAQIVVNTSREISGYLANPTWSLMPDGGAAIKTANITAAKIRAATSIGTIVATSLSKFMGGGGGADVSSGPNPSGGDGGGKGVTATTSTQTATPSVTLFGQPNQFNNLGNNNQQQNNQTITVNAIVSETQITDVQNKIANIKKNAEL